MVTVLSTEPDIRTTVYPSEAALRASVTAGVVEVGEVFRKGFDDALKSGGQANMTTLIWGEMPSRSGLIIESALTKAAGQVAGSKNLVSLDITQLGDPQTTSTADKLLPLLILIAIGMGGVLVPASSLIDERQKRTLNAVTITPATLAEVYIAKAIVGVGVSMMMAIIVLALNSAFGRQPLLLISTLALSAIAASIMGVLLGSVVKDVNVLLATLKMGSLILIGPALIQLVPSIPQWIAYLFPTFYMMDPVLQVSQKGAGLGDIIGEVTVLLAIIAVLLLLLAAVIERQQKRLALAG